MSEKFRILSTFIKDMSSETPDVESFLYSVIMFSWSKYTLEQSINEDA